MKKVFYQLTILLIIICISQNISAQCNTLWPIVSGSNQVISVNSRLLGSLSGTLTINAGVTLCTEGTASISISSLTNNGTLNHDGSGIFKASGTVINNGIINSTSVGFTKSNSGSSVTNEINATFICTGPISMQASAFINKSGATFANTGAGNNIQVNCNTDNSGNILTNGDFIKTNGSRYLTCFNGGNIIAQNNINLNLSTLTIANGGSIVALNNIDLSGIIINSGLIEAQTGYLDKGFTSNDPLTNSSTGVIKSFGNLTIEAEITNTGLIEITNSGVFDKTNTKPITNNLGGEIIIRGSSSNFKARGNLTNRGRIICEGNMDRSLSTTSFLLNESTGYVRVCNDYSKKANLTNNGVISVGHNLKFTGSNTYIIQNNANAKINIINNLDFFCHLNNIGGQIIVGDSLWHRNNSSSFITISDSGIVFANNYIHDNGALIGGATASTLGFLKIENFSQTLNTVNLSGFIDIIDLGHNGVAPYFDSESPVYPYPFGNITEGVSTPSFANGSFTDTCSGTIIALPIELTNFNVTPVKNKVHINWQTASEINNDFFTIERSKDAKNWEIVSSVNGNGNSNQTINYSDIDYTPHFGVSYYRLKQTDFDGKYEYSKIKPINLVEDISTITIYPNPTNNGIITIKGTKQELSELNISNILGQNINSFVLITTISDKIKTINIENLPKGIYLIKTKTTANTIYSK